MPSRKTLAIGIIRIAVLGISACIEANHEVGAPVAVTSADDRYPVWSPDSSKIVVVTWESGEDGIDRDIYMIDVPATEDVKNENHT